jgi:hypothetical protein
MEKIMKRLIALLFAVSLVTACSSEVNTLPDLNQLQSSNVDTMAAKPKNGLFWDSFKIRMDFVDSTIDGKKYFYCLPAIVVGNGLKEGLFNHVTLKMPGKEVSGYILAAKDGSVYLEQYTGNGPAQYSMNDKIEGYLVGTWSKKGKLDPAKLERISFSKVQSLNYSAEMHINPMSHEYLTITSETPVNPVIKLRSDMLLISK